MAAAIAELAVAYQYARDAQSDPWQFAVEIARLMDLGLAAIDLRWLVAKGYAIHAREITQPTDPARRFAVAANTAFSTETRFLLTDSGLSFAGGFGVGPRLLRFAGRAAQNAGSPASPRWDDENRILYLAGQVVKRFTRRSPNQEMVLAAFEEEGWPARIDDPLPPTPDVSSMRRLHDTIKWLNRNHDIRLLHFSGDGTGEGVRWEVVSASQGIGVRLAEAAGGPDSAENEFSPGDESATVAADFTATHQRRKLSA